jgi:hypothetical protein
MLLVIAGVVDSTTRELCVSIALKAWLDVAMELTAVLLADSTVPVETRPTGSSDAVGDWNDIELNVDPALLIEN